MRWIINVLDVCVNSATFLRMFFLLYSKQNENTYRWVMTMMIPRCNSCIIKFLHLHPYVITVNLEQMSYS